MSTSKSRKSFLGWFKDKCNFDSKGNAVRGPGFFCWAYLFILSIGVITSTLIFLYTSYNDVRDNSYDIKFIIYSIVNILWGIIIISFMYNMCRICRPWTGFGVLILVGFIFRLVQTMLFKDMYDKLVETTKDILDNN